MKKKTTSLKTAASQTGAGVVIVLISIGFKSIVTFLIGLIILGMGIGGLKALWDNRS